MNPNLILESKLECIYNALIKIKVQNYQQKILAESAKLYTLQLN